MYTTKRSELASVLEFRFLVHLTLEHAATGRGTLFALVPLRADVGFRRSTLTPISQQRDQ